jgi:IS5 family transposase
VLDSTPLYDAVATMDTVTLVRSAIRGLLKAADGELAGELRAVLRRDDDYMAAGKPVCDYGDAAAREALVDALVRDALVALDALDGQEIPASANSAVELLALVAGQDVEEGEDGIFRIVRKVAKDRVISTVDPEARHGHKSRNRHFDGYKAHLSIDPDSELIDEVVATPANTPDREAASDLLAPHADEEDKPEVLGDSAYADGATRDTLERQGFTVTAKCPPVRNATGLFTKDRFDVDLEANTVTCPAGQRVTINPTRDGGGRASFKVHCKTCPMRTACTKSRAGRSISVHAHEAVLQRARAEQHEPGWAERYRADRPIVERKIAHFARRPWGGRSARTRGKARIATDLDTRAGAINWARLATLGLQHGANGWVIQGT